MRSRGCGFGTRGLAKGYQWQDGFERREQPTLCDETAKDGPPGPSGKLNYQTRQLLAGTMGEGFLQPKAAAKPGWLTMTPLTRLGLGECGSVRA